MRATYQFVESERIENDETRWTAFGDRPELSCSDDRLGHGTCHCKLCRPLAAAISSVLLSILLYIFTGAFWLPEVWIQIRMRDLAAAAEAAGEALPRSYYRLFYTWFGFGFPCSARCSRSSG